MDKEKYIKQIEINSSHVDSNMANFSRAFFTNEKTPKLIAEVLNSRPDITPLHFGLLAFSAYRYALLKTNDKYLVEFDDWNQLVDDINKNHFKLVVDSMTSKNVNITTKDRYVAISQIAKKLFNGNPLKMCDVGSGFYPLGIGRMLEKDVGLIPADDRSKRELEKLKSRDLFFDRIVASDINEPEPEWTASCVWTNNRELYELRDKLKEEVSKSKGDVEFKLIDVINGLNSIAVGGSFDIVTMANVMYQLNEKDRDKVFNNIKSVLVDGGWFVSLEYMQGGSRRRPFTYAAIGYKKSGNKFEEPVVLAKLDSADCKSIML